MNVKQLFDLSGRVALVTGGSRGLGLQMAEALAEMGANIAITARKAQGLDEAASQLAATGVEVLPHACDLADPAAVAPLVDRLMAKWGKIDILVNNAAATWGAPMEEYPLDAWQKVVNLNLTSIFLLTQRIGNASMIRRRSGKVINISSVAGLAGTEPQFMSTIAYNTTKAGVVNFTRSLACEWARHNIHVNAIAPGVFPSRMSKDMIDRTRTYILARTPLGRLGGDQDLKGATVLLASSASDYITGAVIPVDGGFRAM